MSHHPRFSFVEDCSVLDRNVSRPAVQSAKSCSSADKDLAEIRALCARQQNTIAQMRKALIGARSVILQLRNDPFDLVQLALADMRNLQIESICPVVSVDALESELNVLQQKELLWGLPVLPALRSETETRSHLDVSIWRMMQIMTMPYIGWCGEGIRRAWVGLPLEFRIVSRWATAPWRRTSRDIAQRIGALWALMDA